MIFLFSLLLIFGIFLGQVFDLTIVHEVVAFFTSLCLGYIMIEVGLEFSLEKRSLTSYGKDFFIASGAAILPAVLWATYFLFFTHSAWKNALLAGLSSAPTSAGVLFVMLASAGLSATWVFKKARVLAVLDDLVTVLLLTPLEIVIHGFEWKAVVSLVIVGVAVLSAFRWQNTLRWPATQRWILLYAIFLAVIIFTIRHLTHIHLEILIIAFMWGCIVDLSAQPHEEKPSGITLDSVIKGAFMFLVGLSLPKIATGEISWMQIAWQVLILTILANLGKLFLVFCYKKEASWKERIALGVAMFPRGEVGAAVLLIGVSYGLAGTENTLAVLSLALNLVLTGGFIWIVIKLLQKS